MHERSKVWLWWMWKEERGKSNARDKEEIFGSNKKQYRRKTTTTQNQRNHIKIAVLGINDVEGIEGIGCNGINWEEPKKGVHQYWRLLIKVTFFFWLCLGMGAMLGMISCAHHTHYGFQNWYWLKLGLTRWVYVLANLCLKHVTLMRLKTLFWYKYMSNVFLGFFELLKHSRGIRDQVRFKIFIQKFSWFDHLLELLWEVVLLLQILLKTTVCFQLLQILIVVQLTWAVAPLFKWASMYDKFKTCLVTEK